MEDGTALGAKHYQQEGDQTIEIMQNKMSVEQFIGFLRGNVIKYACRMGCKGEPLKDAQKAAQYATWLVQALKGDKINPNEGKATITGKKVKSCFTCANNKGEGRCCENITVCNWDNGLKYWEPKEKQND